jgi:hypothetical protein
MGSGFYFRLKLKRLQGSRNNEQLKAKVNVLDLAPTKIQHFHNERKIHTAYAEIFENQVLLLCR